MTTSADGRPWAGCTSVASRVGLGLAALGRPVYITAGRDHDLGAHRSVEQLRTRTAEVLDAAYAAGVRYVDCARSYGLSEAFLASWLAGRPDVDDVTVASKWGYRYVGEWSADAPVHEVKDHSTEAFVEQLALTRAELRQHLAVYQVHSVTLDSPALTDARLHGELARLRDTGVRVGFSTSGPAQGEVVRRALHITVEGAPLFSVIQSTWNLLEPSAGRALADAADAGLDVVVKEGLANGRLAPGTDDPAPAAVAARRLAAELTVPLDQVALAAALAQPWASRVLSGAVTPEQVRSNAAAESLLLDAGAVAAITSLAGDPAAYWSERSARDWA